MSGDTAFERVGGQSQRPRSCACAPTLDVSPLLCRPLRADALYSPDQGAAAAGALATYARFAATLDGSPAASSSVAAFDADGFRLTRAEAAVMDPQGRLLLEHTAQAVADAQTLLLPHSTSATGVYVGCMWATGAQGLPKRSPCFKRCQQAWRFYIAHLPELFEPLSQLPY